MSIEDAILKLAESQNRTNQLIESRMNRPGVVARGAAAVGRGVTSVATAPARLASATVRGVTAPFRIAAAGAANVATAPYRLAAGVTRAAGSAATAPFRAMGGLFGGGTTKALNNLSDVVAKEKTQKLLLEQVELFRSEFLSEMKRMREKNLDALEDRRERGKESSIGSRPGAGQVSTDETKDKKGFNIPWKKLLGGIAGLATSVIVAKKAFDLFKADIDTKTDTKTTTGETPEEEAKRLREERARAAAAERERLSKASQNLDESFFDQAAKKNSAAAAAQRAKLVNAYTRMGAGRAESARIAIAEGRVPANLNEIVKDTNTSAGNAYRTTKAATLASDQLDESLFDQAAKKNSAAAQRAKLVNAYTRMGADRAIQERITIAEGRVPANFNEIPEPEVKPSKAKALTKGAGKVIGKGAKVLGPAGAFVELAAAVGDKKNTELGSTVGEKGIVGLLATIPFVADLVSKGVNYSAGTNLPTDMTSRFTDFSLERLRNLKEVTTGSAYFGQTEGALERAIRADKLPLIGDGSQAGANERLKRQKEQEARELENAIEDARRTSYLTGLSQLGINRRKTSLSNTVESLRFATAGGSGQLRKLRRELGLKEGTDFTTDFVGKKDASGKLTGEGASRIVLTEAGVEKLRSAQGDKLQELQQFITQMVANKSVSQNPIVDASSRQNVSNTSNTTVLSGSAPSTVNVYDNMF
jgi:hypothetical protein